VEKNQRLAYGLTNLSLGIVALAGANFSSVLVGLHIRDAPAIFRSQSDSQSVASKVQ
jgi:hypothetical protein